MFGRDVEHCARMTSINHSETPFGSSKSSIREGRSSMPWWGWVTIGALLLVAEMTIVDLEFYLIFLGAAALLTGGLVAGGVPLPFWGQWLFFAAIAVASLVFFRRTLYAKLRPPPEGEVAEGVTGERAKALDPIEPGASGAVSLRGSNWAARNVGETPIAAGSQCRVRNRDGLTLEVSAEA